MKPDLEEALIKFVRADLFWMAHDILKIINQIDVSYRMVLLEDEKAEL